MKKIIKSRIFLVILTAILCTSIGVYAATQYVASQITYKNTTVDKALDDLYTKTPKKFCEYKSGTELTVGAKYECDPGDGTKRNFYILAIDNNKVKLIMEKNITEGTSYKTMTWMNAMDFFTNADIADGLGITTKRNWANVLDIDLPMAQDIANAIGNGSWKVGDKDFNGWFCLGLKDQSSCSAGNWSYATDAGKEAVVPYKWLFNYTGGCSAFGCDSKASLGDTEATGYWTRDTVVQQLDSKGRAWGVWRGGDLHNDTVSLDTRYGVRPVITVLKSNLYKAS